jgi:trans-2,3-dihydro-3-hydroxyanthranilate isomerase
MSLPFLQVDAFTDQPLAGNPCAVFLDCDELSAVHMLAIAVEMNLAESSFVISSERADFGARYFTPAEEIPLAGHPTIATTFALVESGRLPLAGDLTHFTLELPAGVIPIEIRARNGQIEQIIMDQNAPEFGRTYAAETVLPVFGLGVADALPGAVIQTVSTGTPMLMIPLRDQAVLRKAAMDFDTYAALKAEGDFFSPHLFCLGGVTEDGETFARQFGIPPDLLEDPFTGSATGSMAAYLWRYGLLRSPRFIAEQGHWMGRPGRAQVEVVGPPEAIETVRVGGQAALVLRGELLI